MQYEPDGHPRGNVVEALTASVHHTDIRNRDYRPWNGRCGTFAGSEQSLEEDCGRALQEKQSGMMDWLMQPLVVQMRCRFAPSLPSAGSPIAMILGEM